MIVLCANTSLLVPTLHRIKIAHLQHAILHELSTSGDIFRSKNAQTTLPCPRNHFLQMVTTRRLCNRSEEHTSELQSLMRISYAVFCLKTKNKDTKKKIDLHGFEEMKI